MSRTGLVDTLCTVCDATDRFAPVPACHYQISAAQIMPPKISNASLLDNDLPCFPRLDHMTHRLLECYATDERRAKSALERVRMWHLIVVL
jgi:hypothetical protein